MMQLVPLSNSACSIILCMSKKKSCCKGEQVNLQDTYLMNTLMCAALLRADSQDDLYYQKDSIDVKSERQTSLVLVSRNLA